MIKTKERKTSIILFTVLALMILLFCLQAKASEPTTPHPADAMWIESDIAELPATEGYMFNLTVWINVSEPCFSWQFKIYFNNTYLNATRAGYTAGATSEFFQGLSTVPVTPQINNDDGFVLYGESLIGTAQRDPGCGSLAWIEFEVTNASILEQLVGGTSIFEFDPDLSYYMTPSLEKRYPEVPLHELVIIPEYSSILMLVMATASIAAIIFVKKKLQ
ncbi:hypothetical protein J7K27_02555 [Candidatus Bathyarchaeota archaeon]|nr:hypothetical protein [Candidatus Bathyarchaeota archaeon]